MKDEGSGGKRGWPYRHLLPPADAQALRDFSLGFQEGRTGTRPYQKLDTRYQTRTRIRVLCLPEVIRLQPSD